MGFDIMNNKGAFIISLDTELAWGSFDKGLNNLQIEDFKNTRKCIDKLLELLDKYNILATFAFVGHLMLSECHIKNGIKHEKIVRPNFEWYKKDWFTDDPCTNITQDPIWYGADILSKVKKSRLRHEIASHSFSHVIFGDKGCTKECADSDISNCINVAENNDLRLESFVFPRNSEGHKDILKKYGFSVYRGNGNEWYKKIKNKLIRRIFHIFDDVFAISPKTSVPYIDEYNMWNCVGNMLYLSRSGFRKYIPIKTRVIKAKKGIDKAVRNKEVFHLWFHPFNLASDPQGLLNGLEEIFKYVNKYVNEGKLESITLGHVSQ